MFFQENTDARHIIQAIGSSSPRKEKALLLQGTFQRHRLPYTATTKKSIPIQKWARCTLAPSHALQEELFGCHRRWQECASQKAFTPDAQDAEEAIMTAKAKRVLDGGYVDSVHSVDADVNAKYFLRRMSLVMWGAPSVILALIWILPPHRRSPGVGTPLLRLEACWDQLRCLRV